MEKKTTKFKVLPIFISIRQFEGWRLGYGFVLFMCVPCYNLIFSNSTQRNSWTHQTKLNCYNVKITLTCDTFSWTKTNGKKINKKSQIIVQLRNIELKFKRPGHQCSIIFGRHSYVSRNHTRWYS